MLKRKSIYYLNKSDTNAIVYMDASGNAIRLTASDFSSEEEFQRWKEWSDIDFHEEDKQDHIFDNNNVSLNNLPDSVALSPSAEAVPEQKAKNRAREQFNVHIIMSIREKLTDKQFRRIWLYYVHGMTEQRIAEMEGIAQQNISKSILQSVNKLKNFLSEIKTRV